MTPAPTNWLGNKIAPARFVVFAVTGLAAGLIRYFAWRGGAGDALVTGFNVAALVFTLSLWPFAKDHTAADMRRHAAENDANRGVVLTITVITSLTVLAVIAGKLPAAHQGDMQAIIWLIGTLALSWVFANLVFMLHYAHMHYSPAPGSDHRSPADLGGFDFPGTKEPIYWDFFYFAFTAGMSFAASDVNVTRVEVRRVVVVHCLLCFIFNIGALAFTINVLAGAAG